MSLGYDVITHGQTQPCTLSGRLCGKERLEDLIPDIIGDAAPVIPHGYLHSYIRFFGLYPDGGFIPSWFLIFPLSDCVKGIGEQVQQCPPDIL